jgi:hypothetical protein
VHIPLFPGKKISESGISIFASDEFKNIREQEGYQVFEVKSGHFQFVTQ